MDISHIIGLVIIVPNLLSALLLFVVCKYV